MTAVEWFAGEIKGGKLITNQKFEELLQQAKEMEIKQLFLASNTSAKEAYEAGQKSMYCGCYEVSGCPTYEEWLYETFKSE